MKLVPAITKHFAKLLDKKKNIKVVDEKKMYKMKMFDNVTSKVKNNLTNFKTYNPNVVRERDNLDKLIEKVEREIDDIDNRK